MKKEFNVRCSGVSRGNSNGMTLEGEDEGGNEYLIDWEEDEDDILSTIIVSCDTIKKIFVLIRGQTD